MYMKQLWFYASREKKEVSTKFPCRLEIITSILIVENVAVSHCKKLPRRMDGFLLAFFFFF